MSDSPILTTKLKRYGQVTSAVTGLAFHLLSEKFLGVERDAGAHAVSLKNTLGSLKGPLMKIAQFLATIPDALPHEYSQQFLELQTHAPSMGTFMVKRRMAKELGPDWQKYFKKFDLQASFAASLGQVHKAEDHEGNVLACKIQYPDMQTIIEADLRQFKLFFKLYENIAKALETEEVQKEIETRLKEELDYHHEDYNIRAYETIFSQEKSVHIPQVFPRLSTDRLLTMSWMEGNPILTYQNAPQDLRNELAKRLFYTWYYPFYYFGVIHGDPHPGNYTVTQNLTLNLLDFGCIRIFNTPFVEGVIELYHALQNNYLERAVYAYELWGFKQLSHEVINIMTHWAKLLYDPLLEDKVRPLQNYHSGTLGWQTALDVHEALKKAGGIKPPREFVFMDRAAVGIGGVIMRLQAEANWHQLFEELISNFSQTQIKENQEKLNVIDKSL